MVLVQVDDFSTCDRVRSGEVLRKEFANGSLSFFPFRQSVLKAATIQEFDGKVFQSRLELAPKSRNWSLATLLEVAMWHSPSQHTDYEGLVATPSPALCWR